MPRFDFQIRVDERSGHILGEYVECEYALMLQVAQDLMSPGKDVRSRRGAKQFMFVPRLMIGRIEQAVISHQNAERQVLANQIRQVTLHGQRIDFVDQVRHQHH